MKKNILITGGAGFIGSHLAKHFVKKYSEARIIVLDKLTYCGDKKNLEEVSAAENYVFVKADICSSSDVDRIFRDYEIDSVIHLAAESHVDRSITGPSVFLETNVMGTMNLLEHARKYWIDGKGHFIDGIDHLFYHVSTDEVYGSLGEEGLFTEQTPYDPRSPYSASKASSDHLVRAYFHTYKMPVVISNCSNNYGPNQYPEKLIPVVIKKILKEDSIPVYGQGLNVRDWLWVGDHVDAIDLIFHEGKNGETYNIGGNNEWKNIDLVNVLCELSDVELRREKGSSQGLISYVEDRKGHDLRYAIDASKLKNELNWEAKQEFRENLTQTIKWYINYFGE